MNTNIVIGIIVLLAVGGGLLLFLQGGPGEPPVESAQPVSLNEESPVSLTAPLLEQEGSGQAGVVVLESSGQETRVVIKLENALPDVEQPAHFHKGSCDNLGPIEIPLNPVVSGFSETFLDVAAFQLVQELPLPVNVHKSEQELGVYVACGELAP